MWAAQRELRHDRFETVALDLHELGTRPGEFSFVELVGDQLPGDPGRQLFGGSVALETALAFGDRVSRLVLVDTAIGDHEWSEDEPRATRRVQPAAARVHRLGRPPARRSDPTHALAGSARVGWPVADARSGRDPIASTDDRLTLAPASDCKSAGVVVGHDCQTSLRA